MKIPMGEEVAAGDRVGERVVGGAVVSAMESWYNAKYEGGSRYNCKVWTWVCPT